MNENTAVATTGKETPTLAVLLKQDSYANRFKEVLGERSAQFCSSLIAIGNTMKDVEPRSIIGAAMTAACLDLPIDKNLGFAWIVPFRDKNRDGMKVAQFQLGARGYVQLGLRSAQYSRMNSSAINKEVFRGWDCVGEPVLDWDKYDPEKPAWGYFFGFQLVNGFTKTAVWTREKVVEHAKRYSQSYRSGADIWKTQFEGMAEKTVVANTLRKWGPLSIQMQQAFSMDQAVVRDIDSTPEFLDGNALETAESPQLDHPEKTKQERKAKPEPKVETVVITSKPEPKPEKTSEVVTPPAETKTETAVVPEKGKPEIASVTTVPATGNAITPEEVEQKTDEGGTVAADTEKELAAAGLAPEPEPAKEEPKTEPTPPVVKELSENQKKLKETLEGAGIFFTELVDFAKARKIPVANPGKPVPADWSSLDDSRCEAFTRSSRGIIAAIGEAKKKHSK